MLLQIGVLFVLAIGWGFWLWRVLGQPRRFERAYYCGVAGFCLQALLVQFLRASGLPLTWGALGALAVALAGVGAVIIAKFHSRLADCRWLKATLMLTGLALAVAAGQGDSLWRRGAGHYFGQAHIDQLNYVITAEYLKDAPPKLADQQIGLHPWLYKGLQLGRERIAQSIVHAEVAALCESDAQRTYGGTVLVFLILLASTVAFLVRSWGMPFAWALLAGLWAGFSPAVTSMHLDGFFSQTATLFVFPALMGILGPGRVTMASAGLAGIILAFLLGAYPELSLFGLAEAACIVIFQERNLGRLARLLAWMFAVALILNAPVLPALAGLLYRQTAVGSGSVWVSGLPPDITSLRGWAQGVGASFMGGMGRAICGTIFLGALAWGLVFSRSLRRRIFPAMLPFLAVGLGLFLMADFSSTGFRGKYALYKLETSTLPLAVAAITAIAWRWAHRFHGVSILVPAMGFLSSGIACFEAQQQVVHGSADVAHADLVSFRQIYQRSFSRADGSFLIDEPNSLAASWLAYYLRDKNVYMARSQLSDLFITGWCSCRNIPAGLPKLWRVTGASIQDATLDYEPSPIVSVSGGVEARAGEMPVWQAANDITLKISSKSPRVGAAPRWLCFELHKEDGEAGRFQLIDSQGGQTLAGRRRLEWKIDDIARGAVLRIKPLTPGPYRFVIFGIEPADEGGAPPFLQGFTDASQRSGPAGAR